VVCHPEACQRQQHLYFCINVVAVTCIAAAAAAVYLLGSHTSQCHHCTRLSHCSRLGRVCCAPAAASRQHTAACSSPNSASHGLHDSAASYPIGLIACVLLCYHYCCCCWLVPSPADAVVVVCPVQLLEVRWRCMCKLSSTAIRPTDAVASCCCSAPCCWPKQAERGSVYTIIAN
jgi:hypothetical protein